MIEITTLWPSPGGEGAEVIYALRNTSTLPDLILQELANEGQIIRKAYQRRLPSDPSKDYYFMQRNTGDVQSLTVEYGFLDNENDANKLKTNYENYAEAVVRAVLNYIGYDKQLEDTYTVKSGDSLWSIAKKYNTTPEELKRINNLSSNLLQIGQKLKLPIAEEIQPGEYTIYTVKSGDNLYKIASQYGISVSELINYNNLSTTTLQIGQKILIPTTTVEEVKYETYTVKSGDSLYKIANQYNTTVNTLMQINNLTSNLLQVGQKLLIPISSEQIANEITYIVQKGDNLYKIANQYGISVNELKNYNNLSNNSLQIGQQLIIPVSTITYVVKSGDNLYSIANKYNTTVNEIKTKNNLTTNNLQIGQILII